MKINQTVMKYIFLCHLLIMFFSCHKKPPPIFLSLKKLFVKTSIWGIYLGTFSWQSILLPTALCWNCYFHKMNCITQNWLQILFPFFLLNIKKIIWSVLRVIIKLICAALRVRKPAQCIFKRFFTHVIHIIGIYNKLDLRSIEKLYNLCVI